MNKLREKSKKNMLNVIDNALIFLIEKHRIQKITIEKLHRI